MIILEALKKFNASIGSGYGPVIFRPIPQGLEAMAYRVPVESDKYVLGRDGELYEGGHGFRTARLVLRKKIATNEYLLEE